MSLTLKDRVIGKIQAAKALMEFRRHLRNWREVWDAYRRNRPVPPLVLDDGLTLHHGPEDDAVLLFREIFVGSIYTEGGFYTPKPGDTVLDLGGNIGFFALSMQRNGRGVHVHSFEPASDTRARLETNVAENGLAGVVTIYPYAVTDKPGVVLLKKAEQAGHRSLFASRFVDGGTEEEVRAVSLAEAVAMTGATAVDLLKIDIEGAEIEVVEGADAATWAKVRRVVIEYHDLFRPGCRDRVVNVLKANGFPDVEVLPEKGTPDLGLVRARRPSVPA